MPPEIIGVWGEQPVEEPKAQRLARLGVKLPGDRAQLLSTDAVRGAPFDQILEQQHLGVLVKPALRGTMLVSKVARHLSRFGRFLTCCDSPQPANYARMQPAPRHRMRRDTDGLMGNLQRGCFKR